MNIKHYLCQIDRSRTRQERWDVLEDLERYIMKEYGFVYLAHMDTTPYYKIGKSIHPEQRISELDSVNLPGELILVHTIKTDLMTALERDLHQYFIDKHVRGDWYRLDPMDVDYLKSFGPARYYYVELAKQALGWGQV